MSTSPRPTVRAALLIAGIVAVSSTSGAVAAGMITGKDIRNGTVTTADVKDGTLKPRDVSPQLTKALSQVGGYQVLHSTTTVPAGGPGLITLTCPGDTQLVGTQGFWTSSFEAVQAEVMAEEGYSKSVRSYAVNTTGGEDLLHLVAWCGRTSAS